MLAELIKATGFSAVFGDARGHVRALDEDHAALWDKSCERSGKLLVDSLLVLDEEALARVFNLFNDTTSLHINWQDLSGHAFLEGGVFENHHPQAHRLLNHLINHYVSVRASEKVTYKLINFLFKYKPNSWRGDEVRKAQTAIRHEAANTLLWEALSHGVSEAFCKSLSKRDWQLTVVNNYIAKLVTVHQSDMSEHMGFERDCTLGEDDWAELLEFCFAADGFGGLNNLTVKKHVYGYFNKYATLPDGRLRSKVRPWVSHP